MCLWGAHTGAWRQLSAGMCTGHSTTRCGAGLGGTGAHMACAAAGSHASSTCSSSRALCATWVQSKRTDAGQVARIVSTLARGAD